MIDNNTTELSPIQTIETSGILDQKWCYHTIQNYPVLATVTSEGILQLYRLVDENGMLNLKLWNEESVGQNILALSLDWSTNKIESEEPTIVVSDSAGSVTLLRVVGDKLLKIGRWEGHGFEAWITAFNYWNSNVFYSGKCQVVKIFSHLSSTFFFPNLLSISLKNNIYIFLILSGRANKSWTLW